MTISHTTYIWAAYAFTCLTLTSLIIYTIIDYHSQKRALSGFEARGVHRRSSRKR